MSNKTSIIEEYATEMYNIERYRSGRYADTLQALLLRLKQVPAATLDQNEYQALLSSRADMCENIGRLQSQVMDLNERLATSVRERNAQRTEVVALQRTLTAETRETNIWRQTATEVAEERETARAELQGLRETTNERIAELTQKLEALTPAPWVPYSCSPEDIKVFPLGKRVLYVTPYSADARFGVFTEVPYADCLTHYLVLPPEFIHPPPVTE